MGYGTVDENVGETRVHMSSRNSWEELSALLGRLYRGLSFARGLDEAWCSLGLVPRFQYVWHRHVELLVVFKNPVFLRAKRKPPVAKRGIFDHHGCKKVDGSRVPQRSAPFL